MNIEWSAFLVVAIATLVAALALVALYSFAVRLNAVAEDGGSRARLAKGGAYVCFALCGCVVLAGIYLIVPALGGGGGH